MAFTDLETILYGGTTKLTYHDKAHRYYVSERNGDDAPWGKGKLVKGVTTIMDGVLEKSGLMQWPKGLALRELTGFYDFTNESGERMTGFSREVGSLWDGENLMSLSKEEAMPLVLSASKAWARKKKQGADVGNVVHDWIEQYTRGTPFELTLERYRSYQDFADAAAEAEWGKLAPGELMMAKQACEQFDRWWRVTAPKLIAAELLVYSHRHHYAGTFDAILEIDGKRYLVDYKTSNASSSKDAAAPQGVYYSYLIQSAAYAYALLEMGEEPVDDLMIVSARKDGGFDVVKASDLGLSMAACQNAWLSVLILGEFIGRAKTALVNNAKED